MKITFAKREMDEALRLAKISLGAASADDFTSKIVMKFADTPIPQDNLMVDMVSTNGRIGTKIPVMAKVEEWEEGDEDTFAVEGWRLRQWVSAVSDAITFEMVEKGQLKASSGSMKVKLQTFDLTRYNEWWKEFSEEEVCARIGAKRLHSAISYLRNFVGDQDPAYPGMAVLEVKGGRFWANDPVSLAVLDIEPLQKSNLRIHGKDAGAVLSFLASCNASQVSIQETDRFTYMMTDDGTLFAVAKPKFGVQDYEVDTTEEAPLWFVLNPQEVRSAVMSLTSGAARENYDLYLQPSVEEGSLTMRMKSSAGDGSEWNEVKLFPEMGGDDSEFPPQGAPIDFHYILKSIATIKNADAVKTALFVHKVADARKTGFMRVMDNQEGDQYTTLVKWSRFVEEA